jgi:hypothetical protein
MTIGRAVGLIATRYAILKLRLLRNGYLLFQTINKSRAIFSDDTAFAQKIRL